MSGEEEEEDERGSGCGAVLVVGIVVLVPLLVLYAITPEGFILALGGTGWGAIIWAAYHTPRSVRTTPDPAPPPLPERGSEEEPQVTAVRDTSHPNRWLTPRPSRWLAEDTSKETGT